MEKTARTAILVAAKGSTCRFAYQRALGIFFTGNFVESNYMK